MVEGFEMDQRVSNFGMWQETSDMLCNCLSLRIYRRHTDVLIVPVISVKVFIGPVDPSRLRISSDHVVHHNRHR